METSRQSLLPPSESQLSDNWRRNYKAGDFPGNSIIRLMLLAPGSLAAAIFPSAIQIDLKGVQTFGAFPLASNFAAAQWVLEGQPISVRQASFTGFPLTQVRKLGLIAALSPELEAASGGAAQTAIDYVLRVAIGRGIDTKLVSADAETEEAPAGLLHNVVPIAGGDSMSADLSALVGAISGAGINTADVIFATSAARAMTIKLTSGPHFDYRIVASNMVPDDGTIVAIAPSGLLVAGDGTDPRIDVSKQTAVVMSDPATAAMTGPTSSLWQQDLWALKATTMINWAAAPGSISVVKATW